MAVAITQSTTREGILQSKFQVRPPKEKQRFKQNPIQNHKRKQTTEPKDCNTHTHRERERESTNAQKGILQSTIQPNTIQPKITNPK